MSGVPASSAWRWHPPFVYVHRQCLAIWTILRRFCADTSAVGLSSGYSPAQILFQVADSFRCAAAGWYRCLRRYFLGFFTALPARGKVKPTYYSLVLALSTHFPFVVWLLLLVVWYLAGLYRTGYLSVVALTSPKAGRPPTSARSCGYG